MKKIIILGVVFLLVFMSFTSISGIQIDKNIIIPSGRGNILYVGGSGEGNYSKIQDAVDNASDGDTVFVFDDSSPYYEDVEVNNSINLIGEDRDTTFIINHSIGIIKGGVNISGFSLYEKGIWAVGWHVVSNIVISDNHFILQCGFGIQFNPIVDNSVIISNTFTNCDSSIYIYESGNNRISNNTFTYNLQEDSWGEIFCAGESNNLVITNNTFINYNKDENNRRCLEVDYSDSFIIEGNEFNGYEYGITPYYGGGSNFLISHNSFINNDCGISIGGSDNRIINNNFINNKIDASSTIFPRRNIWDGNYWDKWIGNRINLPIFQKFPKLIFGYSGFAIDWHPAKEPYNYTTTQGCGIE